MSLRVAMPTISPDSSVTGLPVISLSVRNRARRSIVQDWGTALMLGVIISYASTVIRCYLPCKVLYPELSLSYPARHPSVVAGLPYINQIAALVIDQLKTLIAFVAC